MQPEQTTQPIPIFHLLSQMQLGAGDIYGYAFTNVEQAVELEMRERVAARSYDEPLARIANHHSIPVMDREV